MRKHKAEIRSVRPDSRYESELIARLVRTIMCDGKLSTAENIVYDAFDSIQEKTKDDPMKVFKTAMDNIKPEVEVKSRRVGGATYQVPNEVPPRRAVFLGLRWLVITARKRSEKSMSQRLVGEIMEAAVKRGGAVRKREDVHRMAEANRAFAHYRW